MLGSILQRINLMLSATCFSTGCKKFSQVSISMYFISRKDFVHDQKFEIKFDSYMISILSQNLWKHIYFKRNFKKKKKIVFIWDKYFLLPSISQYLSNHKSAFICTHTKLWLVRIFLSYKIIFIDVFVNSFEIFSYNCYIQPW